MRRNLGTTRVQHLGVVFQHRFDQRRAIARHIRDSTAGQQPPAIGRQVCPADEPFFVADDEPRAENAAKKHGQRETTTEFSKAAPATENSWSHSRQAAATAAKRDRLTSPTLYLILQLASLYL